MVVELPSSQTRPGPKATPNITSDYEGSLASYFDAFAPRPQWGELVWWPPDAFALANLVLDHTGAYRFVVAPPPGKRWPPLPDWGDQMRDAGRKWRASLPPLVSRYWAVVTITAAPMVCEDLARLDEIADLVRRVGPSLVVAVLLDGPQLTSRWPCRYSSVLTDDPGAAVLTLTSLGMATWSRPPGRRGSRVVAHWNSPVDGAQEIELAPRAAAILLSMSVETTTLWTADGRSHPDVPYLDLTEVQQLRVTV